MAEYRTIRRNGKNQVIRLSDSSPRPMLSRSTDPKWIGESDNPDHKGYVRKYMRDHYGPEAFNEDGTIKMDYLEKAIRETHDRHEITWEKRLVRARTLKRLKSAGSDPYGESKGEAVKQAEKLRSEGDRVRVEETSRKRQLYAPFVGDKGAASGTQKPVAEASVQKAPSTKRIPKETIEIREKGERPYIARITGPDKTYHYKREFIDQLRTNSGGSRKHPIQEVYFKGDLPYGTIIDTKDWSAIVVPKSGRFPNGLRKFATEGMTARLRANRLFEAREKSGYAEKIEAP